MTHNEPGTASYRQEFSRADLAQTYDSSEYGPRTWSTLLWALEQRTLTAMLDRPGFLPRRDKYVDFACGTGRVTGFIAPRFAETSGLDISEAMVTEARKKVPDVNFLAADVMRQPGAVPPGVDLVTAFRFLLNADRADRLPALRWMRSLLRDQDSRVIVNNHSNLRTHKAVTHTVRLIRGRGRTATGNVLSHREVVRLALAAGLTVESVHGMGLVGGQALRLLPFERMSAFQEMMREKPLVQRLGEDQIYVLAPR